MMATQCRGASGTEFVFDGHICRVLLCCLAKSGARSKHIILKISEIQESAVADAHSTVFTKYPDARAVLRSIRHRRRQWFRDAVHVVERLRDEERVQPHRVRQTLILVEQAVWVARGAQEEGRCAPPASGVSVEAAD